MAEPDVGSLRDERYISLTTFKRDDSPVSTPVWVVSDDGRRLLVKTGAGTGKVKRLRRDPSVRVFASDGMGKPRGEPIEGRATILDDSEGARLQELFRRKYGAQVPLVETVFRVQRLFKRDARPEAAYIEIVDR
jgi:uncharacterized protein